MAATAIYIALALWGEAFVDKFARFSMRTQLSPGNLPQLGAPGDVHYLIYTDASSLPALQACESALSAYAHVTFLTFEDTVVDHRSIADGIAAVSQSARKHEVNRLTEFQAIDTCLCDDRDTVLFLIDSDFLFADGSMAAAMRAIEAGARVVAVPTIRLSMELAGPWLAEHLGAMDGRMEGLSARQLCTDLPAGFHHTMRSAIVTSESFTGYPSTMLWPVSDAGFVCRSYFPHPFAFVPTARCTRFDSTIDYDFALQAWPETGAIHMPSGSDEIAVFKLTTDNYLETGDEPRQLGLGQMTHFILTSTNRLHRTLVDHPVRLVVGDVADDVWRTVEVESAAFLDRAYAMVDVAIEQLPQNDPDLQLCKRSYLGPIEDFLSPQRLAALRSGKAPI